MEPKSRAVGGTEHSWCSSVPGGTGIVVLAILTSKPPDLSTLSNALQKLQNSHPILKSTLLCNPTVKASPTTPFSFLTPRDAVIQPKTVDLKSTLHIIDHKLSLSEEASTISSSSSPFHLILEHELNLNDDWTNNATKSQVFYATSYALPEEKWVLVLRLHAAACDRTSAISLLKELLGGGSKEEEGVSLGIESLIPDGLASNKGLWARGMDMIGYSVDSFRLTNLKFKHVKSPRSSQVVRLHLDQFQTNKLLAGCEKRGIKLCGALVAAGLIAAHNSSRRSSHYQKQKKYGVTTLVDCRPQLRPPLATHDFGFYHSAIQTAHVVKGTEQLWDLAAKAYTTIANYKKSNKHFSDMADVNFLMCKAIENPGLTSSSALRTSFMSVFEETVVEEEMSEVVREGTGLEDYVGCASVHGIGPSIALFDTVRDGRLDCACVYPAPLHSRDQIEDLLGNMKKILVEGCNDF